jgi:hypothetical protein
MASCYCYYEVSELDVTMLMHVYYSSFIITCLVSDLTWIRGSNDQRHVRD